MADIVVIDDLEEMTVEGVFIDGKLVASKGELLIDLPKYTYPPEVKNSVKIEPITERDLQIESEGSTARVRCIEVIPDQNLTGKLEETIKVYGGVAEPDVATDTLGIACIERYGRTGNIGKAFVKGFGMKDGAFAESVAHDTHNIIVVGTNIKDMTLAVNKVIELGGGIAIANRGRILSDMRLPVGGLITDELDGHEVSKKIAELEEKVKKDLGCKIHAPFMHLSFLALSTSPTWKITDKGLIDVNNFKILSPIIE
jgi:adenine deaminase